VVELPLSVSQARHLLPAVKTTRSNLLSASIDILTAGIRQWELHVYDEPACSCSWSQGLECHLPEALCISRRAETWIAAVQGRS
jgi:hypothetical protein